MPMNASYVVYVKFHLAQSSLTSANRLETMRITLYQESVGEFRDGWIRSGTVKQFIIVINSVLFVTEIRNSHIMYLRIKQNPA